MEESDGVFSTQTAAGSDTVDGTEKFQAQGSAQVLPPALETAARVHARGGTTKS